MGNIQTIQDIVLWCISTNKCLDYSEIHGWVSKAIYLYERINVMRLDKFLCETGYGTRTEVKKLIKTGNVTVNGVKAVRPEQKVDEESDAVCVDGKEISYAKFSYYIFNKPAGCVTATEDSRNRTVMDYIDIPRKCDFFPVGRLDIDTEGLLLITNDGKLAHELLSPAKHVPKTYYARIDGQVTDDDVKLFAGGVDIGEKTLTRPAELIIKKSSDESEILLTITEGKFHQVKRMFHAVGKEVIYLKRMSMGGLSLPDDLALGEYRELTMEELVANNLFV